MENIQQYHDDWNLTIDNGPTTCKNSLMRYVPTIRHPGCSTGGTAQGRDKHECRAAWAWCRQWCGVASDPVDARLLIDRSSHLRAGPSKSSPKCTQGVWKVKWSRFDSTLHTLNSTHSPVEAPALAEGAKRTLRPRCWFEAACSRCSTSQRSKHCSAVFPLPTAAATWWHKRRGLCHLISRHHRDVDTCGDLKASECEQTQPPERLADSITEQPTTTTHHSSRQHFCNTIDCCASTTNARTGKTLSSQRARVRTTCIECTCIEEGTTQDDLFTRGLGK